MAFFGASSGDDASAWADFAAAAGLDMVGPTMSTSPSTTTAPGLVEEAAAQPTPGSPAGENAAPPTPGEPALVEPTTGEEDIAPPVLGVPLSSEDEEELLADYSGAPLGGVPPVAADTADVGVQTAHNVVIPAFDLVDVASQTDGKVAFFVLRGRYSPGGSGDRHSGPVAWELVPVGRGASPGTCPAPGGRGAFLAGRSGNGACPAGSRPPR